MTPAPSLYAYGNGVFVAVVEGSTYAAYTPMSFTS